MHSSLTQTGAVDVPLGHSTAYQLVVEDTEAVLRFLPKKPAHCAYLTDLIEENGLVSPLNRGKFYASKNFFGEIQGVALIGHATIIEPRNNEAVAELARAASDCNSTHLVMTEEHWADKFLSCYVSERPQRRERRELLMELRWPGITPKQHRPRLRRASLNDLHLLAPVHARLAYEKSAVDPCKVDPEGFIHRYQQRIRYGRSWVSIENDELIFKADVVAATRETCYVEGIWVNPNSRGRGLGQAYVTELARLLLWQSRSLSVLVSVNDEDALSFYRSCGFYERGAYRTVFLTAPDLQS